MIAQHATNQAEWDAFLCEQQFSPFLQSWTMGEVYRDIGQEPIRLEVRDGDVLKGICHAIIVPARRGRHLAVPYGPVTSNDEAISLLMDELSRVAKEQKCSFIRVSPFWPAAEASKITKSIASPMHLLAEHVWYLPLTENGTWKHEEGTQPRSEGKIMKDMRKNTRNLIRRAERDGVVVKASKNPAQDIEAFLSLHDETRKRHGFTPYPNSFIRSQVKRFTERNECTLYVARFQDEIIASSVHMHIGGETSYHHGASSSAHAKIPASYLLQWTAIQDALKRGDHTYSFWGIAPEGVRNHPFAGVRTFKRGFGGELLELMHCKDIPLSPVYRATRAFEKLRKWKRGF